MEYLADIVIKALVPIILSGIIGLIVGQFRAYKKAQQAKEDKVLESIDVLVDSMKTVTHSLFFSKCEALENKDIISDADYEDFERLHESYHNLGMNGTGDKLYHQIQEKRITLK